MDWLSLGVYAGWGLVAGAVVPEGIRMLPEPQPRIEEDKDESASPRPEKVLYADLAAIPGLRLGSALACAVIAGAVGAELGFTWAGALWAVLAPIGVALAVIDWRTMLLPTWVVGHAYAIVLLVLAAATATERDLGPLMRAGWGWLIAGVTYFVLWLIYPRGMGYGDVRLSGVLGLGLGFLGWGQLFTGIYSGFLLGGVIGALLSAFKLFDRKAYPFGPFMLIGALVGVFFGADVAAWYWG